MAVLQHSKKGKLKLCHNYRTISLINHPSTVVEGRLIAKIAEEREADILVNRLDTTAKGYKMETRK